MLRKRIEERAEGQRPGPDAITSFGRQTEEARSTRGEERTDVVRQVIDELERLEVVDAIRMEERIRTTSGSSRPNS